MATTPPVDNVSPRLYAIAFVLVAFFAIGRIRQYLRLRHFGGPTTTGFSWLWHSRAVISGQSPKYYGEVCEKYGTLDTSTPCKKARTNLTGPIARIAPNHLITSDPDFWARINAVRSPYRRSPWYYHAARFEPGKDNVFTDCDNDSHDARRKKMTSAVSEEDRIPIHQCHPSFPAVQSYNA
jgi:hypothetical protein